MDSPLSILWFRQDLRLADNPALIAAAARGQVLPVYILADENAGADRMGAASRWWLHHALGALDQSLDGKLYMARGDAKDILPALAARVGATAVFWNRAYEPWRIARDTALKSSLEESGIEAVSSNGALLWEPWEVLKQDGTPYKVFTPFYRRGCLSTAAPRCPLPVPSALNVFELMKNMIIKLISLF